MESTKCVSLLSDQLFVSMRHTEEDCIRHLHPRLEIVLVTDGFLTMEVGASEYRIPTGFGIFVPPFEPHLFRSERGNRYHVFEFSGQLVPFFLGYIGTHEPTEHIFAVSDATLALARSIPDTADEPDYIEAQAILAPLCYEITRKCRFAPCSRRGEDISRRAVSYMCLHFSEPLSLSEVAHAVGAHPVTLSKALSERLGIHFHTYLEYLRCSHALGLIRSGRATMTEIAYRSGFGSIRSFNRSFLTVFGKPPGAYRGQ